MKDIYTVIIVAKDGTDVSTVSYELYEDAVMYCLNEIQDSGDVSDEDLDRIQEELLDQGYYDDYGTKYYIEDAKLM